MPPLPGTSSRNLLYNSESIESCPIESEIDSNDASEVRSDMMDLDEFLVIHAGRLQRPHNSVDRESSSSSGNILSDLYYSVRRKRDAQQGSAGSSSSEIGKPTRQRRKPRTYKYNPQPVCQKGDRNFVPDLMKDDEYWDKRERNNQAAKKSREDRRRKEVEIINKLADLEKRNADLEARAEVLERRNHYLENKLKQIN